MLIISLKIEPKCQCFIWCYPHIRIIDGLDKPLLISNGMVHRFASFVFISGMYAIFAVEPILKQMQEIASNTSGPSEIFRI